MPRQPREIKPDYCYHITTRCNNREFKLSRRECREVFLYAIKKAFDKFQFKHYALCIMSNHVQYLIEPLEPEDLPKIMHWLNWYTAMCFNRMLKRTGHFWEKRYHSSGFPITDKDRALNTLRYIHANPKAAGCCFGFFYEFSNYGTYDRLTNDGITQWHPAFLELGQSLDECATKYRGFCKRYRPSKKEQQSSRWGSKFLGNISKAGKGERVSIAVFVNAIDHQRRNSKIHVGVVNFWAIYQRLEKVNEFHQGKCHYLDISARYRKLTTNKFQK